MIEPFEFMSTNLKAEARLLLYCARTRMDAAHAERIITLLQGKIDWDEFLQMALQHHVAPLLYRNLESIAPGVMPATIRAKIKEQIQVDIQGNLFLTKQLLDVMKLFDEHDIQAIPYKGPVLAVSVYHDLALRPFDDLDILVHERDLLQAVDLLVSFGYEVIRPRIRAQTRKNLKSLWINQLINKLPWAYQVVLWNPDKPGLVELHWRVMAKDLYPRNPKQLWGDLKQITIGGVTIRSFAPENLLWFLCLHGAKHQWRRLRWVCDIAELIHEYPDLDWQQVMIQAIKLGVERRLYLGLLLANRMLDTPIPPQVERKIHTIPHIRDLAQEVMERFISAADQTTESHISKLAFQLRAIDYVTDRGWYLLFFIPRHLSHKYG